MPVGVRHNSHSIIRDVGVVARLGVATAIFVAVLIFEIRGITKARHPMLRAGVAMAIVIPLFLVFFAWIYLNMSQTDIHTFGIHLSRMEALYFTVTVFSTVGFGDITPHSDLARLVTTIQMIADLAVIAIVVRLILGVASRSAGERSAQVSDGAPGPEEGDAGP
jgi:ACR3 family arsenite efflux pump ArsB